MLRFGSDFWCPPLYLARRAFPAGMEPTGVERHRRSPQGERTGASEWSQRDTVRHRRSKAEVADRELGKFESINRSVGLDTYPSVSDSQNYRTRSRRESNPHLRFRKPLFYPLNYGNNDICDFRFSIADCKHSPARRGGDVKPHRQVSDEG